MDGIALWITGLPGSGKSTVTEALKQRRPSCIVLRMDDLRKTVTPLPTYDEAERDIVYRCLVYVAQALSTAGHDVIIDATGHLRKWRNLARSVMPRYAEAYLRCDPAVCRRREEERTVTHNAPRGIYRKAAAGWPVPGAAVEYEEPENPEITIDAASTSPDEAAAIIDNYIAVRQK